MRISLHRDAETGGKGVDFMCTILYSPYPDIERSSPDRLDTTHRSLDWALSLPVTTCETTWRGLLMLQFIHSASFR